MSKKNKKPLVPKLRFPEFRDKGEWEYLNGNHLFNPIVNKDHNSDLPILAISQEHGAIPRHMIEYHVSVTEKSIESYKVVEIGDFIISLRSFQGGIEYSAYKGICSPAYIILRKKNDKVKNQFYRFYFKSDRFIVDLNKNLEGIRDGKMVSYPQFSELSLPFPTPLEQQRIADCLSSLDELITAEAGKLEAYKDHKKALMQKLFPAEGQTVPQWRFPEFQDAGEWKIAELSEVCNVLQGYGFPEIMQGKQKGRYPFCKVSDISKAVSENGGMLSKAFNYIDTAELTTLRAKPVPKGTTVFAKIGEALRLNRRAITTIECVIDNNAVGLKEKKDVAVDYFIFLLSQLIDSN